jgi:hypothetical protein
MEITITNFIDNAPSFSDDKEIYWLSCKMANGKKIIFWGSVTEGTRNIDSLRNQKLPINILIESPEDCVPSLHVKSKYGVSISVPEHVWIQINPEV